MKVLVINCGSSSLKYQLIEWRIERFWQKVSAKESESTEVLLISRTEEKVKIDESSMPTHAVAVQFVLDALTGCQTGCDRNADEITAIGHRVLHAVNYLQ